MVIDDVHEPPGTMSRERAGWRLSVRARNLIIAAVGGIVMAVGGAGLASYADLSSSVAVAGDTGQPSVDN